MISDPSSDPSSALTGQLEAHWDQSDWDGGFPLSSYSLALQRLESTGWRYVGDEDDVVPAALGSVAGAQRYSRLFSGLSSGQYRLVIKAVNSQACFYKLSQQGKRRV